MGCAWNRYCALMSVEATGLGSHCSIINWGDDLFFFIHGHHEFPTSCLWFRSISKLAVISAWALWPIVCSAGSLLKVRNLAYLLLLLHFSSPRSALQTASSTTPLPVHPELWILGTHDSRQLPPHLGVGHQDALCWQSRILSVKRFYYLFID